MVLPKEKEEEIFKLWKRCSNYREKGFHSDKYVRILPCIMEGYSISQTIDTAEYVTHEPYSRNTLRKCAAIYDVPIHSKTEIEKRKRKDVGIECVDLDKNKVYKFDSIDDAASYFSKNLDNHPSEDVVRNGIGRVLNRSRYSWRGMDFYEIDNRSYDIIDYIENLFGLYEKYLKKERKLQIRGVA